MTTASYAAADRPMVSIGMPVYNEERHITEALDYLLAQDYGNFELIIADNASEDATPQICAEYTAKDKRIRYFRNETNIGGIENFNVAFKLAQGEYFMWASGHDIWCPSFISRCMEAFRQDDSVVLAYPNAMWVDPNGQPLEVIHGYIDTRGITHQLSRFSTVLWGTVTPFAIYGVIKSSALRKSHLYKQVYAPDMTLLAEMSLIGTFANVQEVLFKTRKMFDYGSWEATLKKHFLMTPHWKAQKLYWRMIYALYRGALRNCYSHMTVVYVMAQVLLCMFTKYRWILTGLLSLRRGNDSGAQI